MKLTIFKPALPVIAPTALSTLAASKEAFEKRLGALRTASGRTDRFVSLCACAVHDRTFTVVYERGDPERPFIVSGVYKEGGGDTIGSTGAARSRAIPAAEVDHTGWRCPYCASNRHIRCYQCHRAACGGKTHRYPGTSEVFACRASCGARGTLVEAQTVEGIEPVRKARGSRPLAERLSMNSAELRTLLPSPSSDRLRLGWSPTAGKRLR